MEIVRDLIGGCKPSPILLPYNGDLAADSTTKRYKGSLVKLMDFDDIDHGTFFTFAGLATAMENLTGILEEEVSAGFLPDDAAYKTPLKSVSPCFPSTIIRAEYGQTDAAAAANYDTGATATAASATFTIGITTAKTMIGGWVWFINGANAGYLHYITDNDTTTATFATAVAGAVVAADDFLVICSPATRLLDLNATYTGIKSEIDNNVRTDAVVGLMTYISAPGIPFQQLDRNKHDGLKISNAKFYHDFTIPVMNLWSAGVKTS